jgi:hypothetical protein
MADFCSNRISTVTGQVSVMPQTAVVREMEIFFKFYIFFNV